MEEKFCKGCSATVWVSVEETYEKLVKTLLHGEDAVDKGEYEHRLSKCRKCPSLVYGTTCKHCGCLVHARALTKTARCPNPGSPAW